MVVLQLTLTSIYEIDDFNINFTYLKKIVNSFIEGENLEGRERSAIKRRLS